jgi:hypothetical protein
VLGSKASKNLPDLMGMLVLGGLGLTNPWSVPDVQLAAMVVSGAKNVFRSFGFRLPALLIIVLDDTQGVDPK